MLMSLFIHEGFAGTKRRRRRRIACDGKRPQRVIILPWLFFFFSRPGTKRFVTVSTRLCTAHLSRHGDANNQSPLCLPLSPRSISKSSSSSSREKKNARKQKSLSSSSSPCPCCKFGSHPTRCCRAPFTNHLQYISHRWSKMIFCQAICSESLTHIGPLPFDESCSRIFSHPHTTDVVGLFFFYFC